MRGNRSKKRGSDGERSASRDSADVGAPAKEKSSWRMKLSVALAVIAGAAGVGFEVWWDHWQVHKGTADSTYAAVQLGDGSRLAVETVSIRNTTTDPATDQRQEHESTHWRLRIYDGKSGKAVAMREIDGSAECVPARSQRVWCRWEGKTYLLDRKLLTVADQKALSKGPLAGGFADGAWAVGADGALNVLAMDGGAVKIDPDTLEVTGTAGVPRGKRAGAPMIVPTIRAGGAQYELVVKRGQARATLHRQKGMRWKYIAPRQSWLADGFLSSGEEEDDSLILRDGFFLVHHDTMAKDSPRRISRLDLEGNPVWTAALPEPILAATLGDDQLILSGAKLTIKLGLRDGAVLTRLEH